MKITRETIPHRMLYALAFATAFVILGNQVPDFYYKNLDHTEYFTVRQPVPVDKHDYHACDEILVDLVRSSTITSKAVSTVELILTNEKGEWVKQTIGGGDFIIDKSQDQILHTVFNLPCATKPGKYFLKAVVSYHVRGIEKNYTWESAGFEVKTLDN